MATLKVIWTGKFDGRLVEIEEADFNPAIHRLPGDPVSAPVIVESPVAEEPEEVVEPAPKPRKRK